METVQMTLNEEDNMKCSDYKVMQAQAKFSGLLKSIYFKIFRGLCPAPCWELTVPHAPK